MIDSPKRIIHKHQSYEKFKSQEINKQNIELMSRIISTNCQVIKNRRAATSYKKHRNYSNIRSKYMPNGQRKDVVPLINADKLCPTLREYH